MNLEPRIIVLGIASASLHLVLKSYHLTLPVRSSTCLILISNSSVTCGISTLPAAAVNVKGRSSVLSPISLANCGWTMLICDPVSYSTFKFWRPSLVRRLLILASGTNYSYSDPPCIKSAVLGIGLLLLVRESLK